MEPVLIYDDTGTEVDLGEAETLLTAAGLTICKTQEWDSLYISGCRLPVRMHSRDVTLELVRQGSGDVLAEESCAPGRQVSVLKALIERVRVGEFG